MKILILYNYFLPAFKAGGPIQSIANLIRNVASIFEIYVITSDLDLGSDIPLEVKMNSWQDFENGKAKVLYLSKENFTSLNIKKIIQELKPDTIFVNGIYSLPFSLVPAFYFPFQTVMHIRGMLHPGALAQKALKKKFFLFFLKLFYIHKKIRFCVSDVKEEEYAKAVFGNNIKVHIAQNFPAYFPALKPLEKGIGQLHLCSIGLISPIKNHALVLEALALVKTEIVWHIYGPVKDANYWKHCQKLLANLPDNIKVNYKQEISPSLVYDTLKKYHVFILPSQSENFGHALYEAMIAAKPIITSHNTPWNQLEVKKAGINVDLKPFAIAAAIEAFAAMSQDEYNTYVSGVRNYAENAIDREAIKQQYLKMFGVHVE